MVFIRMYLQRPFFEAGIPHSALTIALQTYAAYLAPPPSKAPVLLPFRRSRSLAPLAIFTSHHPNRRRKPLFSTTLFRRLASFGATLQAMGW